MKAGLIIPRITASPEANVATIERMAAEAVSAGAQFLLLPEAVLTGLTNNDDPEHDLPLGQPIPGPATDRLGAFCARHGVWLGLGLIEREANRLYDSAVLLGADGAIHLKYRRNHSHWHARNADPAVYCQGTEVVKAETPFGTVGFLICGDLFGDDIVARFRDLHADWLLFLLVRSFDEGFSDQNQWQNQWEKDEAPAYSERIELAQTPTLMVNYLGDSSIPDDGSFGGAFAISAEGEFLASYPLGKEGILFVDMDRLSR